MLALPALPTALIVLKTKRAVRTPIPATRARRRSPIMDAPHMLAVSADRHTSRKPTKISPLAAIAATPPSIFRNLLFVLGLPPPIVWPAQFHEQRAFRTPQSGRSAARTAAAPRSPGREPAVRKGDRPTLALRVGASASLPRRRPNCATRPIRCGSCSTRSPLRSRVLARRTAEKVRLARATASPRSTIAGWLAE